MTGVVYVVFCMDTEGPCDDPSRSDLLANWQLVDRAMDKLFDPVFRSRVLDASGKSFKVGWFFLTWTGFSTNPRHRDVGYHKVRDHYLARYGELIHQYGDEQCWHYHQPPASGVANEWGFDWFASKEYDEIICRQLLERHWFPVCYRAGGTVMSPASSRWIDNWFPIDYTNRAPIHLPGFADWRAGIADWHPYHPDPEDFRLPGPGRRKMVRCLDLATSGYTLQDDEIAKAFRSAQGGTSAILAVFDHDYRDIAERLVDFRMRVSRAAACHASVAWEYAAPVDAVRRYTQTAPSARLDVNILPGRDTVRIWANRSVFQAIPWLAVRRRDGQLEHVTSHILATGPGRWLWHPPADFDWCEAAVGVSTEDGAAAVSRFDREGGLRDGFMMQPVQSHPIHPRSIWEHSRLFFSYCGQRASGALAETDSVRQAVEILSSRLKEGMSVLDVGCGAGHAFRSLAELGVRYFGIDTYASGIELGRWHLSPLGLPEDRLRVLGIEDLPLSERYEAVICLNVLCYLPMFHAPLEIMARAATRWLVIRGGFGDKTEVRYLPDVLLEQGFHTMRTYFNVYGRAEVAGFLEAEGFRVSWIEDRRQAERFFGRPEEVGGIPLPAEFLVAERVRPEPAEEDILGQHFAAAAKRWHSEGSGGPNP